MSRRIISGLHQLSGFTWRGSEIKLLHRRIVRNGTGISNVSTILIFFFLMMKQIIQLFASDMIFILDPDITECPQYFRLWRSFCPLLLQTESNQDLIPHRDGSPKCSLILLTPSKLFRRSPGEITSSGIMLLITFSPFSLIFFFCSVSHHFLVVFLLGSVGFECSSLLMYLIDLGAIYRGSRKHLTGHHNKQPKVGY